MYGPNTNIVINGSIIYFSECEAHYILESVRMLLEGGHRSDGLPHATCTTRTTSASTPGNRSMAWGVSTVNSWYKNPSGPRGAELALLAARVLAADARARPGRLRLR